MRNFLFLFAAGLFLVGPGCRESLVHPIEESVEDLTPTATLAAPAYSGGHTVVNATGTATLNLSFTDADSTTLTAASGDTSAAPSGLIVSTTGGAACTTVSIVSPSSSGAQIVLSGCSGDGSVLVQVDAGAATSADQITSDASATQTVLVGAVPPTATLMVASATGAADASNTATVTFSELVTALSATNANGEIVLSGCIGQQPDVAIAMSDDGSGHSIATLTIDGSQSDCLSGDTVSVELHLETVTDTDGNAGRMADNPAPETYSVP